MHTTINKTIYDSIFLGWIWVWVTCRQSACARTRTSGTFQSQMVNSIEKAYWVTSCWKLLNGRETSFLPTLIHALWLCLGTKSISKCYKQNARWTTSWKGQKTVKPKIIAMIRLMGALQQHPKREWEGHKDKEATKLIYCEWASAVESGTQHPMKSVGNSPNLPFKESNKWTSKS